MKSRVAEIEGDLIPLDGSIEHITGADTPAHPVAGQCLHPVAAGEPPGGLAQLQPAPVRRTTHIGTIHALPDCVPGSGDACVWRRPNTAAISTTEQDCQA